MNVELKKLLLQLKESKNPSFKKIASLAKNYTKMAESIEEDISRQEMLINMHELESLVNPDKFDFQKVDLGIVAASRK